MNDFLTLQNVSIGPNGWQLFADIATDLSNKARKVKCKQLFSVNVLNCQLQ